MAAGSHVNWMEASLEQLSAPLPPWAIRAGAREVIYHDPRNTTAAIVTCGGLCPGLNDVVAVSRGGCCMEAWNWLDTASRWHAGSW